jgi:hypothetical protein
MPCILIVIHVKKTGNIRKNVTLRRVRVNIVAVKKAGVLNIMILFLYSCLIYPACNAPAAYYIVTCGLSVCSIFFHIIWKSNDFRENVFENKMHFNFSSKFSAKFFILRRIQRGTILNVHRSSCKVAVILVRFW